MPSDTSAAPSVTDPELLRQANAGADWQCGYCGSHQRRLDGACAQCGAAQSEGRRVPVGGAAQAPGGAAPRALMAAAPRPAKTAWGRVALLVGLALAAVPCVTCMGVAVFTDPPPPALERPVTEVAEVTGGAWTRVVHIERYRVIEESGFVERRPADAFDIESLGQAHHHDEQVLDHYETEHYTEQVPYQDTETYTDQESCGEDCVDLPESCSEVCTPDDNGFASCNTVCSGGGQSCTTRYCSVTRTRTVTRYRSEPRTRQVPRYRTEPRYAERFRWHVWRWGHDRDVTEAGDATQAPAWPTDEELAPPAPLAEGERERTTREETYAVLLRVGARDEQLSATSLAVYDRLREEPRWHVYREGGSLQVAKPVHAFAAE